MVGEAKSRDVTTYFVILTEFTFFAALWHALRGKTIYIGARLPHMPPLGRALACLERVLVAAGLASDALNLLPEEKAFRDVACMGERSGIFWRCEAWMRGYYEFDAWESRLPEYAMAFKHAACSHVQARILPAFLIATFHGLTQASRRVSLPRQLHVLGVDATVAGLCRAAYGLDLKERRSAARVMFKVPTNVLLHAAVAARTIGWICRRLRVGRRAAKLRFPVGVDYNGHLRDLDLLRDVLDTPAQAVLIARRDQLAAPLAASLATTEFRLAKPGDARYSVTSGLAAFRMIVADGTRLACRSRSLRTDLAFQVAKFAPLRAVFRGLAERLRFSAFWSRDDYSFEHALRTAELRRAGIVSIGINHGLPVYPTIEPAWRYIDYDLYYVFGRRLYEGYYQRTWSAAMRVEPIGSVNVARARRQFASQERDHDIVYFASPYYNDALVPIVTAIARAFPDRRLLVKIKPSRRLDGRGLDTAELLRQAAPNIVEVSTDSYELMTHHRYALACASTVAAETVQFGMMTFVFDIFPAADPFYYRDFPEMCLRSGEEAVEYIRAIEAGIRRYPFERLGGLVDLSGRSAFDAIRQGLGLSPGAREAA